MNRKNLKYFLLLLLSMFISEILNGIVYLISYCYIDWEWLVERDFIPSNITVGNVEIISKILVALFAIISYIFIGKTIFCKFTNRKHKRNATIVLTFFVLLSYLLTALFEISTGWWLFTIHWSISSPIASVLLLPFQFIEKDMPILFYALFILFSPIISILLIWMFSKIGDRKRDNTGDDYYIDEN